MAGRNLLRQDGVALVTVSAFLTMCLHCSVWSSDERVYEHDTDIRPRGG